MPEKNSAILFDLDGTLLNSGLTFHKIVNQLKRELGQEEVPFKEVKKFSSRGANLILKNCFPDMGSNDLLAIKKSFLENYYEQMLDDICLYEGVSNLINFLQDKSIAWGIVTNKSQRYTLPIIQKLRWNELTNAIICPEDISQTKPDPEGITLGLKILNASNKKSYYVGDHERDIETGKNAKVKTIACTYGFYETDPHSWNADFIINKPLELINII